MSPTLRRYRTLAALRALAVSIDWPFPTFHSAFVTDWSREGWYSE